MEKYTHPSVELLNQGITLNDIYEHVYKCSFNRPADMRPIDYVSTCIKNRDFKSLAHSTVFLKVAKELIAKYDDNFFSEVLCDGYVTTNYSVLVENDWLEDLKFLCPQTKYHYKRVTLKLNVSYSLAIALLQYTWFNVSLQLPSDDFFTYPSNRTTLNTLTTLVMTGYYFDWEKLFAESKLNNSKEAYYIMGLIRGTLKRLKQP